jgi:hypothetical protein
MIGSIQTRRRFLVTTALGGLGLAGTARAFTPQPMTAETHRANANACSGATDPYHRQLAEEIAAKLGGSMSQADIDHAIAAARCPICGCGLVGVEAAKAE